MTELNRADRLYIGGELASAAFVGSVKVWPMIFRPIDISGCVVWLDASKITVANGAAVNGWTNLGSGPQPATFLSPAPTLRTNALNGLPVVKITKGQGTFRFTGTGITKDWTVIYVARRWRNTIGRILAAQYVAATNTNLLIGFWNQYMDVAYTEGWVSGDPASGGSATTWKMYSADSNTAAATPRLFSNGVLIGTYPTPPLAGAPPSPATWNGTLCLGHHDAEATENSDCEIAEVVMYNRKLSDAERQQVEGYLRNKWNPAAFKLTDLGADLVGWFDATDAASVQLSGSGVSNWINKGVGAMTLTQSNDAYRPTYANQTVTITTPQIFVPGNSPTGFDMVWAGKPKPASSGEWRTLLRGTTSSHQVIIETGSIRFGTYNAGFWPAGGIVSPKNMTSNTAPAPFGTAAISEYAGGYEAWRAFDADPATLWHTATPATSEGTPWIKVDLGTPRTVTSYKYQARSPSNGQSWRNWVLDGSNDNVNWTRVDTVVNEPNTTPAEIRTFTCDTPGAFRFWLWTITATWGTYAEAASLELIDEQLTWDAVWGIGSGRFGSGPVTLSRNGGGMISTGTTLTAADVAIVGFGGYQGPPPSQGWGDLKEVVLLPYNSQAVTAVEGYLAHRHGLTGLLPASHLYKATPP
jgi:hypothetical protein